MCFEPSDHLLVRDLGEEVRDVELRVDLVDAHVAVRGLILKP